MLHPQFCPFLSENWSQDAPLTQVLALLTPKLQVWNKECFGHLFIEKRRLLNHIGGIQKAISYRRNPYFDKLEANLNQ